MKEGTTGQVDLKGVKIHVAKQFLKFFYTDTLQDCHVGQLIDLILAASMYDFPKLLSCCDSQLVSKMTLGNACFIYQNLCILSPQPKLSLENSLTIMHAGAEIILYTDSFLDLTEEALLPYLSDDKLNVGREIAVFNALWRWGEHQCGLQSRELNVKNIMDCAKNMLSCVRLDALEESEFKKFLKKYLDSNLPSIKISDATRENDNLGFLLQFCEKMSLGNRPLQKDSTDKTNLFPFHTNETLFIITTDVTSYLLGFQLSIFIDNPSSDSSGLKIQFDGKTYAASVSEVVEMGANRVVKVTVTMDVPIRLTPWKDFRAKNASGFYLYYHCREYDMYKKPTTSARFVVKTLKNMACTLFLYPAPIIAPMKTKQLNQ